MTPPPSPASAPVPPSVLLPFPSINARAVDMKPRLFSPFNVCAHVRILQTSRFPDHNTAKPPLEAKRGPSIFTLESPSIRVQQVASKSAGPFLLCAGVCISKAYLAASSQDLRLLAAIGAAFLDRHSMKARKRREVPTKLPGASGRMKTVQSVRFDVRSLELMYTSSPVLSKYTAGEGAPLPLRHSQACTPSARHILSESLFLISVACLTHHQRWLAENQTRFLIGGTISATDLSLDYTSSKCTMDCSVLKWGCSPCKSRLCEAPSTCEDHMDVRAAKICWDCTDGGVPTCLVATSSIQASLGFITPLIFLKVGVAP